MSNEKKTLPSLSALARQSNSSSGGSLAQLKQKMQNQSTAKSLSPLQSLAQKNTNKSTTASSTMPSLASLAQRSTSKVSSLGHLATRNSASVSKPAASIASSGGSGLLKLSSLAKQPDKATLQSVKEQEQQIQEEKEEDMSENEDNVDLEDNSLCAKPSVAAQFLFEQQPKIGCRDNEVQFLTASLQTMFYDSLKKSSSIPIFPFDKPSPDDIIFAAQNQRGAGSNKKN
ncbi:hypothetical protein G6F57_011462 [Rhizopus arrhizus]|uniref:Uncharacterized protein n=1 Tax=Rhizopus oryzae TaxID=64495 RepID=A0A9P6WZT1_RHIOR|nr:hypothetical protein G6F23_009629 [Rhizopus arrhizus]KAG1408688.1 hypothetical protein G6F58_009453 [Rhizopus delemar]KAG0761522.1 hypothetical protein G6F24_007498 [Rhizopus arrhizus]KAG0782326.1 hypothetical protein G6F21_011173 [Rhizopus arrhizus]KAG0783869.1 hypothetical protein G6F22_008521 [Rhizopus arrhizus]